LVARLGFLRGGEAACLQGIGELLQGLVPLFLRVDPGDVRVLSEVQHPHFQAPTLILYDRVPGGVGLSERVFRTHRDLLRAAVGVARRCPCTTGCPACVGPHPSLGARSKQVAIAILDGLLGDEPRGARVANASGSDDAAAFGAEG
jgi:DEAD/DEAH box helicase domain-containing protein